MTNHVNELKGLGRLVKLLLLFRSQTQSQIILVTKVFEFQGQLVLPFVCGLWYNDLRWRDEFFLLSLMKCVDFLLRFFLC